MQRQVLEGSDVGGLPAASLRPADGQHVVGKVLPEDQAGRVRLGLGLQAAFKDQVRRLRRRRGSETGGEEEADETEARQETQ